MKSQQILERVAFAFNVPVTALLGQGRTPYLTRAKVVATLKIREAFPHWALEDLAMLFGMKQHGTISHRLKLAERAKSDPQFQADLARCQ